MYFTDNDPNVIVVDGTTIYMPEDADIQKTVSQTGNSQPQPPPPKPLPSVVELEQKSSVPTSQDSAKQEEVPLVEPEHTTPQPETPPAEPKDEEINIEEDDGTNEAVSEPPEVKKEESMMDYLTGWIDHSGSGDSEDDEEENEETDTGQSEDNQVDESVEESSEKANPEPPETTGEDEVDLSKINLLSLKGNLQQTEEVLEKVEEIADKQKESIVMPGITEEIPHAMNQIPEEPPMVTIPSPYPDPYNTLSSDEINHQYASYSTPLPPEEETSTENTLQFQSVESVKDVSTEVPNYSSEFTTESAPVSEEVFTESVPVSEEVFTESAQVSEEVFTDSNQVSEEAFTESNQVSEEAFTESAQVSEEFTFAPVVQEEVKVVLPPEHEILQPAEQAEKETVTTAAEQANANSYNPYANIETGQVVEVTTGVYADDDGYPPVTEEATTPASTSEEAASSEETSTAAPEGIEEADEGSGRFFADWIYNLFGFGQTTEEVTEAPLSEVEMLIAEPEETATTGSWFWSSTPVPDIEVKPTEGEGGMFKLI